MRPDTSHWHMDAAYDDIDHAGVDHLAWECLRRNRDYQADYTELRRIGTLDDPLPAAMEARWGLRFPGPTGIICH
ncbi:DUF6499 domain-containing protein [Paracoccus onubensis]|uniref:transcriptional regulator domain-containing protein n=1 Tax=Paracoccus onubensis TaxID=1675788 RepID=UPI002731BC04|nr:DUF6499 domain-containing protein [Paracoccus onubensis]MDP0926547.1 DUF6499 domain-containing protein [Paracoccus onubensis]